MDAFRADLLEAVRDMKAGRAARTTTVAVSPVAEARIRTQLTQAQFAKLLGVSVRTLQEWEQGRRQPSGAAQSLLRVAQGHPDVLRELAQSLPT
jgi:putative transcriptional regulator